MAIKKPQEPAKPSGLKRTFTDSDDLCRYMVDTFGDTVFLQFSMGKDSLVTWLQCRRFWKRIIPIYHWFFPDLEFVEKQLRYYEDFFQTPILRYPRETFFWHLDDPQYQPPHRVIPLADMTLPRGHAYNIWNIEADLRVKYGLPQAWTAQGLRAFDSLTRRTAFRRSGPMRPVLRFFYPIYDWKFDRMAEAIRSAAPAPGASVDRLFLPVDYRLTNRSFDSPRYRFLVHIKRHFPRDYERIKFWLPLVEAEMKRREFAGVQTSVRETDADREAELDDSIEMASTEGEA